MGSDHYEEGDDGHRDIIQALLCFLEGIYAEIYVGTCFIEAVQWDLL